MMWSAIVSITTPKNVALNGFWLGPERPRRVYIWVHGLGSSLFSKTAIMEKLVDPKTAVLAFNNRGHDVVARISHVTRSPKKAQLGGAAHEVFTDCVDDIEGAVNFAKKQGVKEIYLTGHSTGCQKSIYWASKKRKGVKGIVLLAPISDYSAEVHLKGRVKVARALRAARALIARGKKHALLPTAVWPQTFDAQRFVSLFSQESKEEIFPYWNPAANPRTLKSVKIPLLVLLAENDEYADRPAKDIAAWFQKYAKASDRIEIIPSVEHSFKGGESSVCLYIRNAVSGL